MALCSAAETHGGSYRKTTAERFDDPFGKKRMGGMLDRMVARCARSRRRVAALASIASPGRGGAFILLALVAVATPGAIRAQEPQVARAAHGMVVSHNPLASRAGVQVLEAGGNAVDAAIATALALAVTNPQAGNLGGGGFLLYFRARDSLCTVIDFRDRTRAATPKHVPSTHAVGWTRCARAIGHSSVGCPEHRRLPLALRSTPAVWRSLVAPALRLAQEGSL